jgi:outer membrane protein assembly factor BamE
LTTSAHVRRISRFPHLAALAVLPLVLGGCAYLPALPSLPSLQSGESFLGVVTPYRMDIVQGNVVTQELAARVQPGMTRAQVRDLLGSPMLTDPFHADRWDYAFTIQRQGTQPQQRKLSVFFQNDAFYRYEADELPSESEFAERLTTPEERKKVPRLQATPQELDKFKAQTSGSNALDTAPEATAPRKQYPPLESTVK